jgi:ATP-dependent helicase HrpB
VYRGRLGLGARLAADGDPGALLAAAFPDRIGQSRGEPGSYRLSGGGSGQLPNPADPLARRKLLVIAALDAKGGKIRLAAGLDAESLPPALRARLQRSRDSGFDPATGGVLTRERLRLGALILADRTTPAAPEEAQAALAAALATRLNQLDWTPAARNFQARVALLRAFEPDLPDLADGTLATTAADWSAPWLAGMTNFREVKNLDVLTVLRGQLDHEQLRRLERALPAQLALPGGRVTVDYTGPVPVAAARARDFYGLDATPRLAEGRIPLQLALLSPAGRPIAVTADLASFWRCGWRDARRDMRGRYPKHDWPEEPWRLTDRPLDRRTAKP